MLGATKQGCHEARNSNQPGQEFDSPLMCVKMFDLSGSSEPLGPRLRTFARSMSGCLRLSLMMSREDRDVPVREGTDEL